MFDKWTQGQLLPPSSNCVCLSTGGVAAISAIYCTFSETPVINLITQKFKKIAPVYVVFPVYYELRAEVGFLAKAYYVILWNLFHFLR